MIFLKNTIILLIYACLISPVFGQEATQKYYIKDDKSIIPASTAIGAITAFTVTYYFEQKNSDRFFTDPTVSASIMAIPGAAAGALIGTLIYEFREPRKSNLTFQINSNNIKVIHYF